MKRLRDFTEFLKNNKEVISVIVRGIKFLVPHIDSGIHFVIRLFM